MPKPSDAAYSEDETTARREAALKRMLNTPHKPHKPVRKPKAATRKGRPSKKRNAPTLTSD